MLIRAFGLVLSFFIFNVGGYCQTAAFVMHSLTVKEGLPQGWVRDIAQDKTGFIWLACDGLCRYNGRTFTVFRHQGNKPSTLKSNDIVNLRLINNDLWLTYLSGDIDIFNTVTHKV